MRAKVLAFLLGACLATPAQAQEVVVRIGHVAPLSGPIAHLGRDLDNGARLAVEDLNARGLSIGGRRAKFELVSQDDRADPKEGTAAAQRLVDLNVHAVVGHLNSGTSLPASRIYAAAGIPQISPTSTHAQLTRQGYRSTFRMVVDDTRIGAVLGRFAVQQLQGRSVAVIDDRTAYGQGIADEFEKAVKAAGGTVVAREYTTPTATDFQAILTTIRSRKPDVVFLGGMDSSAGPMLKQMQALGLDAKFVGGDGVCTGALPWLAGNAIVHVAAYCAEAGGVEGAQLKAVDEFSVRFKKRFGSDVHVYAALAYDAVQLLADAMVRAGSVEPARYLPELAATKAFRGLTGPIAFDERGDVVDGAVTLYTYRGWRRERVAVVRP